MDENTFSTKKPTDETRSSFGYDCQSIEFKYHFETPHLSIDQLESILVESSCWVFKYVPKNIFMVPL